MQHLFHQPTAQKWLSSELHFATPAPKTSIQTRPMPSLRPTSLVAQLRKSLNPLMRNVFYLLLFSDSSIYIFNHTQTSHYLLSVSFSQTVGVTTIYYPVDGHFSSEFLHLRHISFIPLQQINYRKSYDKLYLKYSPHLVIQSW